MVAETEANTQTSSDAQVPQCFSMWSPGSVVTIFCVGLMSGVPGGLLLGRTAVIMLRAVELLANNKLLMDQLENYIHDFDLYSGQKQSETQRSKNDSMCNMFISLLIEKFGVFSITGSLAVGIPLGLSMNRLVIKRYGETSTVKALAVAGPLCLMGVTATGCALGIALEWFLLKTSSIDVGMLFVIVLVVALFTPLLTLSLDCCFGEFKAMTICLLTPLSTPFFLFIIYVTALISKTKLILVVDSFPMILGGAECMDHKFELTYAPLPLMLIITDVFNIARQPIIALQPPTDTHSAVVEGLFVGVLTSQFVMVIMGMTLFATYRTGGVGKICAGAVTSGGAVIAVIESVLHVLGPGPTICALMGVGGAVGVILAAAGECADSYGEVIGRCGLIGRLGVTGGAAVGAFLTSCTHSGLSRSFMVLCATVIPGGLYLPVMLLFVDNLCAASRFNFCLHAVKTVTLLVWLYFTTTIAGAAISTVFIILVSVVALFNVCIAWFHRHLSSSQSN